VILLFLARKDEEMTLEVNSRELATILAALCFHQEQNLCGQVIGAAAVAAIATDDDTLRALNHAEVEELCQRLQDG
jgi:hypothetical protein